MTEPIDSDALEHFVQTATPEVAGRWRYRRSPFPAPDARNYAYVEWGPSTAGYGTGTLSMELARYIAAVSPDRILALIAENRRLREALIADVQTVPDALALFEKHGFVFQAAPEDQSLSARWERLAFTLYTRLAMVSGRAERALAPGDE